jgi:hypothetical protein
MSTDAEIRETAVVIREGLPDDRYNRPLWQGVLDLIERSDFGRKDAAAEVESPLPPERTAMDEIMDGSWDGVQMEMLNTCVSILGGHGSVALVPYSKGVGTRSMTFVFKVKV